MASMVDDILSKNPASSSPSAISPPRDEQIMPTVVDAPRGGTPEDASSNMQEEVTMQSEAPANSSANSVCSTPARTNNKAHSPSDARYTTPVCIRVGGSGDGCVDESCCPVCLISFDIDIGGSSSSNDRALDNPPSSSVQNGPASSNLCPTPGDNATVVTRCKHKFHAKCLQQAKQLVRPECPLCRGKLTPPSNSEIRAQPNESSASGGNEGQASRHAIVAAASRGRNAVRAALMRRQAQQQQTASIPE